MILNDYPFNFGGYTGAQCRIEQVIKLFQSLSNWMCFLWRYLIHVATPFNAQKGNV